MVDVGEIIARTGARSPSFDQKTGHAFGAITPADIAASIATVRNKSAALLIQAKYIDNDPGAFPGEAVILQYQRTCTHRLKRPDTVKKLASAAVKFYIRSPRCRRCRGHGVEWDQSKLRFLDCKACHGLGGRTASVREIARLSGMSRSKIKDSHVRCFWELYQIMAIWESVAASQIKRALRR